MTNFVFVHSSQVSTLNHQNAVVFDGNAKIDCHVPGQATAPKKLAALLNSLRLARSWLASEPAFLIAIVWQCVKIKL